MRLAHPILASLTITCLAALGHAADQIPLDNVVVVSGEATLRVKPDTVQFRAGFVAEAATVKEAFAQASALQAHVLETLRDRGVKPGQLETTSFSLEEVERKEERVGFRVEGGILVSLAADAKVGDLIEAVVDAGANRLRGPGFSLSDDKQYTEKLLALAFQDAKSKALSLASLAGRKLGKVLAVSDRSSSPFSMWRHGYDDVESGVPGGVEVHAGLESVTIGLTVAFRLE